MQFQTNIHHKLFLNGGYNFNWFYSDNQLTKDKLLCVNDCVPLVVYLPIKCQCILKDLVTIENPPIPGCV